ncbi:MAG: SpoIIE family protein phosphatase [Silvanigrellaceae bacterium]
MKFLKLTLADVFGYIDLVGLWKTTKLRNRIAILAAGILLGLISLFSFALYYYLAKDKKSYAFDAAFAESESVSMSVTQVILETLRKREELSFIPWTGTMNANSNNLVAWPSKGELFFTLQNETVFAYTRDNDENLVFSDATEIISTMKKNIPNSSILVTTTGDIIETAGRPVELVRRYVKEFISSGVKKGVHSFELDGKTRAFAFSQAPNSNAIIVTDAFIEESMRQITALTIVIFTILFALVMVSITATIFFVQRSLSPLSDINEAASQIAGGNFNYKLSYYFKDEISETFQRIENMRTLLRIRDSALTRTTDYLSQVLELVRATAKESDAGSALKRALQALVDPRVFPNELFAAHFNNGYQIEVSRTGGVVLGLSGHFSETSILALLEEVNGANYVVDEVEEDVYLHHEKKLLFCNLHRNPSLKKHRGWIVLGPLTVQDLDVASLRFLGAFSSTLRSTLLNIELKNVAVEQGRMQLAFEAAAAIQENLSISANIPANIQISAKGQTAETVGGDWHSSFYHAPSRTLYCYMTDVTGHGLNATLLVSSVRGAVESMHLLHRDRPTEQMSSFLSECALVLDSLIAEVSAGKLVMTMFMMSISIDDGKVRFLNFGHPAPLVFIQGDDDLKLLSSSDRTGQRKANSAGVYDSLGFGIINSSVPPLPVETILVPGDVICLFTDGFLECRNQAGEFLGRKKARQIIHEAIRGAERLDQAMSNIYSRIDEFRGQHPLEDDISLLMVKRAA